MTANSFRLLVVDDDPSIRQMLSIGLRQEGYLVELAEHGEAALEIIPTFQPHVIILDVMMPKMDGYDLCIAIPAISNAAVIMLTAKDKSADIVRGLRLGANDYLPKPFHFEELLARIEVQLRHHFPLLTSLKSVGDFTFNEEQHLISYKEKALNLAPKEFKLLSYFLWNPNQVLNRDAILTHVWGYDFSGDGNIVEVYVRYLRDKLEDSSHSIIQTIRGVGYRLVPTPPG